MAAVNTQHIEKLLVVAIDFGTSYSGYAFSFKAEYITDPMRIYAKRWPDGYTKTPTVLLLDQNQEYVAFGSDAETKYAELAHNNDHYEYYYFRHFKMALHAKEDLTLNEEIEDKQGRHVLASIVFMHSIRALKGMIETDLKKSTTIIKEDEIYWILTVPAIWNDAAKQFMREAAVKAGIKHRNLRLALEPEAASIYCKEKIVEREETGPNPELTALKTGSKFMVVDMGGGTVDVTVREVAEGRKLKEIHIATGGPWGGMKVNENFMNFMEELLGHDVWYKFCADRTLDMLEMEADFERKKRGIGLDSKDKVRIRLPFAVNKIFKKIMGKRLDNEWVHTTGFQDHVQIREDKLILDPELIRSFFNASIQSIVEHLQKILDKTDVGTFYLVGGFAESPLVYETFLQKFPGKRIVCHEDAALCVLRGAVLYGHDPKIVVTRICRNTYGTEGMRYFIKDHDPEENKVMVDGEPFCKVFHKYAEIEQAVSSDEQIMSEMEALTARMTSMKIPVLISQKKDPVYTSKQECRQLGNIRLKMSNTTGGLDRKVTISMVIGDSELDVEAVDTTSGEKVAVSFDLLGNASDTRQVDRAFASLNEKKAFTE
ncbi:hypothetical protein ACJMK2_030782 [Sinanodonta woodiana]|uniref:Heat shock 70 kDa protein 12A n=1 Tax=Sinanodonta woodiana TaxID=1069815 RepID=A0ABD3WWT2_SINWO